MQPTDSVGLGPGVTVVTVEVRVAAGPSQCLRNEISYWYKLLKPTAGVHTNGHHEECIQLTQSGLDRVQQHGDVHSA
jgi:hypothetical protein